MSKRPAEKPTDSRKKDAFKRKVPALPRKDTAMRRFSENIDMGAFKEIIADSTDDKLGTLLQMLHDPAYRGLSFPTLARKAGVPLQRLQEVYTDGMRHIGMIRMATHLPNVME